MQGDPGLAEGETGVARRQAQGAQGFEAARGQAGVQRVGEQAIVQAAAAQHHGVAAGEGGGARHPVFQCGGERGLEARGAASGIFLIGYGAFRFITEFFREPDAGIFGQSYSISMGQWLSLPMILIGLLLLTMAYRKRA